MYRILNTDWQCKPLNYPSSFRPMHLMPLYISFRAITIYYENRTQGTLKTIKKKKHNQLKSNACYILH